MVDIELKTRNILLLLVYFLLYIMQSLPVKRGSKLPLDFTSDKVKGLLENQDRIRWTSTLRTKPLHWNISDHFGNELVIFQLH